MTLDLIAMALAAIAVWRTEPRSRSVGLLAALVVGVAAGSLRMFDGPGLPGLSGVLRGDFAVDAGGLVFLNVVTGLVLLGIVLSVAARPGVLTVAVAGATVWLTWPLWGLPGISRAVGTAAATLALAILMGAALTRLLPGRTMVALDRVLLDRGGNAGNRPGSGWRPTAPILATTFFGLLALLVPHLWTTLGATGLALVVAWVATGRSRWRFWILLAAAIIVFVALTWSLRLAGPLGGWIPELIDGPFSPRAALMLAVLIGAAALVAVNAWPLHALGVPMLLSPLALPLAGTFGLLLIPDGVRYWQPILAPLTLVGMMHALSWRRTDALLVGGGMLGFWTATPAGTIGGTLLILSGWVLTVSRASWLARAPLPNVFAGFLRMIPSLGALLVLRGHLATEVAYGVVAAGIAAVAIGRESRSLDLNPPTLPAVASLP